jgi:hypothetical protein
MVVSSGLSKLVEPLVEVLRDIVHMAIQAIIRDTGCFNVDVNIVNVELLHCLEDHGILVWKHALQVGLSEGDPPISLTVHSDYDLSVLIYNLLFTIKDNYMNEFSRERCLSS